MIAPDGRDQTSGPGDPAIVCTLTSDDVPARRDAWKRLLDRAESSTTAADGSLRAEFGPAVDLVEIARLVAAEQQCCTFFSFTLYVDHRGLALDVRVPAGAIDIATALFSPEG